MKVIHLTYPITTAVVKTKVVLALGFFDGVHRGHQHLLKKAKTIAQQNNLPLMVLSFDRHPSEVYAEKHDFQYIDTLSEKTAKMEQLGVDYFVVLKFTKEFSEISGQQFVDSVLIKLNAAWVVAGFDYTYGPKNKANMDHLPVFAKNRFQIVTIPKQTMAGEKIGSTEIRRAINAGEMELVKELLGQHYVMSGIVSHGQKNGHKLGFPTANLAWDNRKAIPKIGVYATKTKVNGKWYESMTSVGYNVTIGQARRIYIESNLFDFDQDIYDQPIVIKWYKYTRGEIKFAGLKELKQQLHQDQKEIQAYFKEQAK